MFADHQPRATELQSLWGRVSSACSQKVQSPSALWLTGNTQTPAPVSRASTCSAPWCSRQRLPASSLVLLKGCEDIILRAKPFHSEHREFCFWHWHWLILAARSILFVCLHYGDDNNIDLVTVSSVSMWSCLLVFKKQANILTENEFFKNLLS